ncbi:MAG TPA: amidase [Candidatus Sulfotelmatobacter sp.]|nr:amidase [Candidatus Sulfotelmatobacter sp.]
MPDELTRLSIAEAGAQIRRRALSPVELTQAYLTRIQKRQAEDHAYITLLADQAISAAKGAEEEIGRGQVRGPLHGIPVALKDLVYTKGVRTTCGSKVLKDWVPRADGTVARRLAEAGAILLGKLNLHEFAYGPTGINPHYGTARNPWGADRMPGGSSSGSGVAVAAGLCAGALGSDTGGSVRIPASLCGIVGLKPTYGRVSRAGVFALAWSLDHIGPMTRTVEDAALLLQVLAGPDPRDSTAAAVPVPDYRAGLDRSIQGLRLGLLRDVFFERLDPDVRRGVEAAAQALQGAGAALKEITLPAIRHAAAATFAIISAESMAYHERLLRSRAADYGADVRSRLLSGQFVLASQYLKAQRVRRVVQAAVDESLREVDALLLPSTPLPAPRLTDEQITLEGTTDHVRSWLTRCTRPFNLTGHPTLSVPCGLSRDGLPISLQLVGRTFDEATLFRIGHAYERVSPLRGKLPPLAG